MLLLLLVSIASCSKNRRDREHETRGMFRQNIRIRTLPTNAKIFINDREIGTSPLTYTIRHEERRMFNIKAVPLYPNQYTQNIFLMVPPIPKRMTIYMNHYPEDYDRSKDTPYSPPEKPLPEVIIETKIDTIYVETHTTDLIIPALPVIYFDTDLYNITYSEEQKLIPLVDLLKKEQSLLLDIYGFADIRATEEHNIKLSLNRANSVRDYLIRNGINPARLASFGHGKISKVTADGLTMDLSENRKVIFLLRK